jgi:hypothetical protein
MGKILFSYWTLDAFKRREDERRRHEGAQSSLTELARLVDANQVTQEHVAPVQKFAFLDNVSGSSYLSPIPEHPGQQNRFNGERTGTYVEVRVTPCGKAEVVSIDSEPGGDSAIQLVVPKLIDRPHDYSALINRNFGFAHRGSRSWRAPYVLAAIAVLGLGGLVAGSALQGNLLNGAEDVKVKDQSTASNSALEIGGRRGPSTEIQPGFAPTEKSRSEASIENARQSGQTSGAPLEALRDRTPAGALGSSEAEEIAKPSVQTLAPGEQQSAPTSLVEPRKIWTVTISPDGAVVRKGEMLPAPPISAPRLPEAATKPPAGESGQVEAGPDSSRDVSQAGQFPSKPKSKALAGADKASPGRRGQAITASPSPPAQMDNGAIGFVRQAADSVTSAIKQLGGGIFGARP